MTNHHVLSSASQASEAIAQLRYERTIQGTEATHVDFTLATSPAPIFNEGLDFALVGVGGPVSGSTGINSLDEFGWLRLNPQPGKAFVGNI